MAASFADALYFLACPSQMVAAKELSLPEQEDRLSLVEMEHLADTELHLENLRPKPAENLQHGHEDHRQQTMVYFLADDQRELNSYSLDGASYAEALLF